MITGYGATIVDGAWLTLQLAPCFPPHRPGLLAFRLSPVRWLACGDLYARCAAFPTWC